MHAHRQSARCSNPEVKGLKVLAAIKRARLITESYFWKHSQDVLTCTHGEATIVIFAAPCWFPLFTIEWFVVGAKNGEQHECARDNNLCMFCCAAYCNRSMLLTRGHFKPYRFTCAQKFASITSGLLIGWLQNALGQRVPITTNRVNRDGSSSASSTHEPPAWLWLTPPEQPWWGGGATFVQRWITYSHKLFFVLVQLQCITNLVHPWVSLCIKNFAFNWYLGKGSPS